MPKKHMKKCSTSLAIKKMKTKTTLKFHLTHVRMTIIKNTNNNKYGEDSGWEERNMYILLVEM
jgi:S-adenosylhomocysteine hydrolase